ncbi:hypothetical protein NNJEOMEG_03245 [Fundidesulfovibrio magnetotacticus]|uniref:Uncharacterized protein n=1 Tax=Fundidesulfovibrio magnetotacticus TaxID=2730080 RepID=A0A6V8LSD2_9BACT|nr:hypothetical protein NNJEOMEG_03245 [Fundidesulfovibrio magnetotacticus]
MERTEYHGHLCNMRQSRPPLHEGLTRERGVGLLERGTSPVDWSLPLRRPPVRRGSPRTHAPRPLEHDKKHPPVYYPA